MRQITLRLGGIRRRNNHHATLLAMCRTVARVIGRCYASALHIDATFILPGAHARMCAWAHDSRLSHLPARSGNSSRSRGCRIRRARRGIVIEGSVRLRAAPSPTPLVASRSARPPPAQPSTMLAAGCHEMGGGRWRGAGAGERPCTSVAASRLPIPAAHSMTSRVAHLAWLRRAECRAGRLDASGRGLLETLSARLGPSMSGAFGEPSKTWTAPSGAMLAEADVPHHIELCGFSLLCAHRVAHQGVRLFNFAPLAVWSSQSKASSD